MLRVIALIVALSTTTLACEYKGQSYQNGDEWTVQDQFIMRCTVHGNGSWKTEIVGCRSPQGAKIELNGTRVEGTDEYRCIADDNGMVRMSQAIGLHKKCGTHAVGDKWVKDSFEHECLPGGREEVTACVTSNGVRINVNSVAMVNGRSYECIHFTNNHTIVLRPVGSSPNTVQSDAIDPQCVDSDDTAHKIGTWWIQEVHFNKTCGADGRISIANCVTRDGQRVPVNGQLISNGLRYNCEKRNDGSVFFRTGTAPSNFF